MMTRYGSMATYETERDLISRCLDCFGEWAWHEVVFVGSVLAPGARVLDIGAFLGTFSLGLAASCDVDYLCAVEANPSTVILLAQNICENVRNDAVVVEAIVAAAGTEPRPGRAPLDNRGATSFRIDSAGDIETDRPARAMTLADLRNTYGPFDLVKIDAEGMEMEILISDSENLARGDTAIWLECNEAPSSLKLAQRLLSWGLDVFYFAFPAHNTANYRGNAHALLPSAYEAGLLAAPRVRPLLDAALAAHGCILQQIAKVDDLKHALWRTPRWGMAEWADASPATITALAVHALFAENFENYLASGWQRGEPLWVQLKTANAALANRTTEVALLRQGLAHISEVTRSAEAALSDIGKTLEANQIATRTNAKSLGQAQASVDRQLNELMQERERRADAEATLANCELRISSARSELIAERQTYAATMNTLRTIEASAAVVQHLDDIMGDRARLVVLESLLVARDAELAQARTFADRCRAALADASALSLERLGQLTTLSRQLGAIRAAHDGAPSDISVDSSVAVESTPSGGEQI